MKILIDKEDLALLETRFKNNKSEILKLLNELQKLSSVRIYVGEVDNEKCKEFEIDDNLSYSTR